MSGPITNHGREIEEPSGTAYYNTHENWCDLFNGCGQSWKAMTYKPHEINDSSFSFTDNFIYFRSICIPKSCTVTGAVFYQGTQGNYTGDNNNYIFLYKVLNNGALVKVAGSSNNANLWKGTANTYVSEAFASTYPASPGMYMLGFLYNQSAQTTAPTFGNMSAANTNLLQMSVTFHLAQYHMSTLRWGGPQDSNVNAQTALPYFMVPNIVFSMTAVSADLWCALY